MRHPVILLLFTILAPILLVHGQEIPIGTWRSHLNYSRVKHLALYQNKVYAASNFGLFYFDTEDNSLQKLTKNDGFSDVGVTALAGIPNSKGLIIGYGSGQIDILEGNRLTSISTIKQATIASDKAINSMFFHNQLAYLCTDFGLVALDYNKKEIKESYSKIGEHGGNLQVLSGTVYNDSIFLATTEGVISSSAAPTNNLMDFNNWRRLDLNGITGTAQTLTIFSENLYVSVENQGLYYYDGFQWKEVNLPFHNIKGLHPTSSDLYILSQDKIYKLSPSHEVVQLEESLIQSPSDVVIDQEGHIFIADLQQGLITNLNGSFEHFYPNGPLSEQIDQLYYFDNKVAAWGKGYNDQLLASNKLAAFSIFHSGRWESYSENNTTSLLGIKDITGVAYSQRSGILYLGTFGGEVLGWHADNGVSSPLNGMLLFAGKKITAMASDRYDNILFNTYNSSNQLYSFNEPGNDWSSRTLGGGKALVAIMASDLDQLWFRSPDYILVADRYTNTTQILNNSNNSLISGKLTDLATDKNDVIWYGSTNGLAYIPNPWEALEGNARSIVPIFENQALFRDERIDVLKVDGANRKWIGTKDGLWIFGEDGDELLAHFTEDNSPLLSNNIMDIEINPFSGEVFIATAKGLVSFRSRSSEGTPSHQNVKIFPNPVWPGYNGQIGISGLVENAIVKITDAAGNLVREVRALGGTATWDGNTLSGKRASTGVYLVFSASQDGTEHFVGKLAIIQ